MSLVSLSWAIPPQNCIPFVGGGGIEDTCPSDGNPCTDDICVHWHFCEHPPVYGNPPCNDGNACTEGDYCASGQCQPGDPIDCTDGNPCTTDSCSGGTCVHTPVADACCDGGLATTLDGMLEVVEPLADQEGLSAVLEVEEPTIDETGVYSSFRVFDATGLARSGTITLGCSGGGALSLLVDGDNAPLGGDPTKAWTLSLSIIEQEDVLYLWGSIDAASVSPPAMDTWYGGWMFSQANGPEQHPESDAEFHTEAADLFSLPTGGSTAAINLGTILRLIINAGRLVLGYVVDLVIPYVPPEEDSCQGPRILDDEGQDCEGVNIPCRSDLDNLCENIDDIPDVSTAFKKCMKGRCGCGGSTHRRLKITCDESDSCGSCGAAGGCNLGGPTIWYCQDANNSCLCASTVFHEMSHSCGALDIPPPPTPCPPPGADPQGACRIGEWFRDEFLDGGGKCTPLQ